MKSIFPSLLVFFGICVAEPLSPSFTYQGELRVSNAPANGTYDFRFELFDAETLGTSVATPITLEDIQVTDGIFSAELDFGSGPFAGDQLWVEIALRDGASSGGYQVLAPRQKLTASPYALHAEMVAASAIGSGEIANNSVGAADIAANAVAASELANNAVDTNAIQDSAVTGLKLAPNSVGTGHIVSSEVQRRVSGICDPGSYLAGINEDGSVLCRSLPSVPTSVWTADNSGDVGFSSSIAVGPDRLPVISFANSSVGSLMVAKCDDAGCTGGTETVTTVDNSAAFVGSYTSIAIGTDGLPVMSYRGDGRLKVAKCNDAGCTGANETITVVDSAATSGWFTSLAIGADGYPIISYWDSDRLVIRVAKCDDVACAGNNETITTLDAGIRSSVKIGTDGLPVIAYYNSPLSQLRVAKCNDAACAGGNETITVIDGLSDEAGGDPSIAIGADGMPVISYQHITPQNLKVAKCNDPACSGGDETISTVDAPGTVGIYSKIAIGTDGLPVISYFDQGNNDLKVAKCNDEACSGGDESITTIDDAGGTAFHSMVIGADGNPVMSYRNFYSTALAVAKCGSPSCQ